ncbi:hypothetical protein KIW84_064160 [Lathyrus oleraceus]|uniref:Agenet-like domain-containing protein n=1 Tax=Pisum sativum TaxID=3888 RepID=A0A9D4WD82_PEA|nr:hypothetical protein KIW84_064160 [Pisum sativum]
MITWFRFTEKIVRCLGGDNFCVEYAKIMVDEEGTKGLEESAKLPQLRPIPPKKDYDSEIKESKRVTATEIVSGDKGDFKFKPWTLVELCSGEDGFNGAWFSATIF